MLTLKVPTISGLKPDQVEGILLSFLSAAIDVFDGKRKTTYLIHFYRERLDRNERKKLTLILEHLCKQLTKDNVGHQLQGSAAVEDQRLPKVFADFFLTFQGR